MKVFLFLFLFPIYAFGFDHDYSQWSKVLKSNTNLVESQVYVDYATLKKHPEELLQFTETLRELTEVEFKEFSKDQQLAFWINAYNALTIEWVIRHYPVKSIKDTTTFISSPWSKQFFKIFNKDMSLDDIEHKTIRKNFKEPRIHFALNCASYSCPSLFQEAFIAKKLEEQLEQTAKNFMSDKNKNYFSGQDKTLYISRIFNWYGADFNAKYKGYMNFIKRYIKTPTTFATEWLDYDWSLNDKK